MIICEGLCDTIMNVTFNEESLAKFEYGLEKLEEHKDNLQILRLITRARARKPQEDYAKPSYAHLLATLEAAQELTSSIAQEWYKPYSSPSGQSGSGLDLISLSLSIYIASRFLHLCNVIMVLSSAMNLMMRVRTN